MPNSRLEVQHRSDLRPHLEEILSCVRNRNEQRRTQRKKHICMKPCIWSTTVSTKPFGGFNA